jgi:AcrR family transcriptional regulator
MGRTKEFDRDVALKSAIRVFGDHGFEGSSTDDLLRAMGISRQSLYDTFGDKKALYLEALKTYAQDSVARSIRAMNTAPSPLKGIEAMFLEFVGRPAAEGCLGVGAICEFGTSLDAVNAVNEAAGKMLLGAFERRLLDAKALGEVPEELDPTQAAEFLATTLLGLRVAARGGASAKSLRGTVAMALRILR